MHIFMYLNTVFCMMGCVTFILQILFFGSICESARILAVIPFPSYSHQVVYRPIWKKLLQRGHEITLLTTEPMRDQHFDNLVQIDWSFANDLLHNKYNYSDMIKNFRENKLKCFNQLTDAMHDIASQELAHADVQSMINNRSEYFDIAIIEFLYPTMLAFSERFNVPYIGVSSMDIPNFGHDVMGNPTNPAVYTDFLASFDSRMSFLERLLNTLNYIGVSLYFNFYMYPKEDITVKKVFGEDTPVLKNIQKKASMVFLNTNPILHDVRPLVSNVLQIGGAIHINDYPKPLPEDLQAFLNNHTDGVIYMSLGSNVKVSDLPGSSFNILLDTFKNLSYGIVWKIDTVSIGINTSNIYTTKWLPQQEVLAHENVKLFITQGGQQSLEESIYYGVPVIGMPFYVDQFANIRRLTRKNACIQLDPQNLRRKDLQNAIHEILENKMYLHSMKKLSGLLKDRPMTSVDQAVWWVEYVIRHKGAGFLKSEVPNIPFYQYYLLDVIGLLTFLLFLCLVFQYIIIKCLIKYIRYKLKDHKSYKLE